MKQQILAIGIGLLVGVTASAQGPTPTGTTGTRTAATAGASLIDTQGRSIGEARLQQTPHGVLLKLDLRHATPGIHGVHIHDIGRCDAPSFESAGGHFNPSGHQHGLLNALGPHAGDLPNIEVPATTTLAASLVLLVMPLASR